MRDTVAVTNPCIVGDLDADIAEDDNGYADSEGSVEYGDAEQLELDLLELGWSLSDQDDDEDIDPDESSPTSAAAAAPAAAAAAAANADSDTDESEDEGPMSGSDDEGGVTGSGSAPEEDTSAPENPNPSCVPPADVPSSIHCCLQVVSLDGTSVEACGALVITTHDKRIRYASLLRGSWFVDVETAHYFDDDPALMPVCHSHFNRDRDTHTFDGPAAPTRLLKGRCALCNRRTRRTSRAECAHSLRTADGSKYFVSCGFHACSYFPPAEPDNKRHRPICPGCCVKGGAEFWRPHANSAHAKQCHHTVDEDTPLTCLFKEYRARKKPKIADDFAALGASLAIAARKKKSGPDALAEFIRGFVEKAAELRDRSGGASSDRHDGVRKTFLAELLGRHVRPLSARAPLIDGLTALSNMPARSHIFGRALARLRVISSSRDHVMVRRKKAVERLTSSGYVGRSWGL